MRNTKIKKLINELLEEVSLDPRIETGIFEIYNHEHLDIIEEYMIARGIDSNIISEFIDEIAMEEGKYPERQAYNKDGWLVTFPSKEYRDAAIKKRTHFTSDPTHGKGGMNLYYKKKGKQKRQTQQDTSKIKPTSISVAKQSAVPVGRGPVQKQPTKLAASDQIAAEKPTSTSAPKDDSEEYYDDSSAASVERDNEKIRNAFGFAEKEPKQTQQPSAPVEAPVIDVPVVTQAPEEYATVSKKFATKKNWKTTEYGEYRDAEGNPVAVTGLTGEVVPIRSNDREEYKIFAEKNIPKV